MPIQTNLPPDPKNPQAPTGQNQSGISVTTRSGQTNPPDPQGTLLPNSVKYQVNSDQFLAVPLAAGNYTVKAREEGQVIYIASTPDADATLRITKAFNIETPGRTALYIKGQSMMDLLIKDLERQIAGKADAVAVYTKEETDRLINLLITQAMAGLTTALTYKGTVPTQAQLPTQNVNPGDVYQALDTGAFYAAGENLSWEQLSGSLVDLNDYYDRAAVDLLLAAKADATTLQEYRAMVENFIPPFTWEQSNDPAVDNRPRPIEVANRTELDRVNKNQVTRGQVYKLRSNNRYYALNAQKQWEQVTWQNWTDPTSEGDTWFNPTNGLIYIRKRSQTSGDLFWLNSLDNYLAINGNRWVTLTGNQNIDGEKKFVNLPEMTSDVLPTRGRQLATKAYVDANGGGGGAVIPQDVARLNNIQTFTAQNTFNQQPIILAPEAYRTLADNKLITKGQVKSMEGDLFLVNPTVTNPRLWDDLSDSDLVTKGVIAGGGIGGNTPAPNLSEYAKKNAENTFILKNTFNIAPSIGENPVSGNDAARKTYVDTQIGNEITLNNQNYFTRTEVDTKLQNYVRTDAIADFMEYKGPVTDFNQLQTINQPGRGDVYYVQNPQDKQGFYIYDNATWTLIGSGLGITPTGVAYTEYLRDNTFANNNVFNTMQGASNLRFEVGNLIKINGENSFKINNDKIVLNPNSTVINQQLQISPDGNTIAANFEPASINFSINPTIGTPNAATDDSLITKGEVNTLIAGIQPGNPTLPTNLAKLDQANTFTAANTFNANPTITTPNAATVNSLITKGEVEAFNYITAASNVNFTGNITVQTPTTDQNAATKKYVDDAIAAGGGGGNVNTQDLAKLNEANNFTADNTTTVTNFTDASLVTKKYVDDAIKSNFTISDIEPNIDKPLGHIWIKKSFVQDGNNPQLFTDIPGIYISVGTNKWWNVHKEELL